MQLKLSESPREWQKFAGVLGLLVLAITIGLWRRKLVSLPTVGWASVGAVAWVFASLLWPKAHRGVYRAGMTASFHVGKVMSAILLTAVFLLCVTPLALLLRALGKDLLRLRKNRAAASYWIPARVSDRFDRMF